MVRYPVSLHWKATNSSVSHSLTTKHYFCEPSFNFLQPSRQREDIMWNPSDTSLLLLVPFRESPFVLPLLFSFCQTALSYRSSLVTFPETTLTTAMPSPSVRLTEGWRGHTPIHRHCQKPDDLQELGNHQNQPTFEMLWISWTCCCWNTHRHQ